MVSKKQKEKQSAALRALIHDPRGMDDVYASYSIDELFHISTKDLAQRELEMVRDGLLPKTGVEQEGLGQDPVGMWTHYPWFHLFFHDMKFEPEARVCDVGAGIGRLGNYLSVFHPEVTYVGLELFEHRVRASVCQGMRLWNIKERGLPQADVYYFYNALPYDAYQVFIEELRLYKEKGNEFKVCAIHDKYGGLREILRLESTKVVERPVRIELLTYSSF